MYTKDLIKNETARINKRYVGNVTDSVKKILGGPDATDADKKGINTTKTLDFEQAKKQLCFLWETDIRHLT